MKPAAALAASVLLLLPRAGDAAVEVRVAGQSVDVQATNAPLSEILERLSRQTQMKVVYEGAPPRQTISLDLRGRTPVEAVVAAFEGQGINYAMSMDDSGTRVQTLLVSGSATASPSAIASRQNGGPAEFPERRTRDLGASESAGMIEEPEPVPEDDAAPPPDTSVGLNAANPQTLGANKDGAAEAPVTIDAGNSWAVSPFAPSAPPPTPKTEPTPQATPPPFNP
jgi:hypothetical protein